MGWFRTSYCALLILLVCAARAARGGDGLQDAASGHFGKTIRSIDYEADRPLDRSHYDPYLGLRPGDPLTRTGVKRAIQSLYETGRFSQISVDAREDDGGVRVVFRLASNYYFNAFTLQGEVNLRGRAPWEVIPLPVGERFTADKLEAAREAVLKYLQDQGYFLARVRARTERDEREHQVDTVFEVEPKDLAVVQSFEIRGVPAAEVKGIQEKLRLKKGERYERDRVRRRRDALRKHLLQRGYLGATPDLEETFHEADNTIDLVLDVRNFERVRVAVEGFRIPKERLRRMLPVLSEGEVTTDALEEGADNLKDFLEEQGHPNAAVTYEDQRDKQGIRVLAYKIDAGPRVTVAEVDFQGNRAFADSELLGAIQIQPARFLQRSVYSVQKLDSDVEALRTFYQARGYLEAAIIPLVMPLGGVEKLRIRFEIQEGALARTGALAISGNKTLTVEALKGKMQLREGGAYSPQLAQRDRQAILAAYNDAGFLQPRVTYQVSAPDQRKSYRVEFQVTEGVRSFVDDVLILGNHRTRESVIERRIRFRKDEPLSLGKMLDTQQALYGTGVFDLVRVNPQNAESPAPYQGIEPKLAAGSGNCRIASLPDGRFGSPPARCGIVLPGQGWMSAAISGGGPSGGRQPKRDDNYLTRPFR